MKRSAVTSPDESGVRARTRTLLVDAAVRVFARKGASAAAIHEITAEAGVANGTFYNYFRTREEILEAASMELAGRLSDEVTASSQAIEDPAERMAIGNRRFVLKALHDPTWSAADVTYSPAWSAAVRPPRLPALGHVRPRRRRPGVATQS